MKLARVTSPSKPKKKPAHPEQKEALARQPAQLAQKKPNQRRALSHVGGRLTIDAPSTEIEERLRRVLDVRSDERSTMKHVHGFHSYPARLHPETAARAVEAWSSPEQYVLDPFCGSGTVLVEARLAGLRVRGSDANPLAVELSWLKARGSTAREREALLRGAQQATDTAYQRRRMKSGASRRYADSDVELFAPHVLLELDGIRVGLESLRNEYARRALSLVLSATLTKVSQRISDSTRHRHKKRIAAGFVSRFFVEKAQELERRLSDFASRLPKRSRRPEVEVEDARKLASVETGSIDLVVSSPPYPGVYDYYDHHEARLRWLELPQSSLAFEEIGSRRQLSRMRSDAAFSTWRRDFGAVHRALRRVLAPEGRILWIIADSVVGQQPLWANEVTVEIAGRYGFELEAIASQHRPYFHQHTAKAFGTRPRREHLLVLRRSKPKARRIVPTKDH